MSKPTSASQAPGPEAQAELARELVAALLDDADASGIRAALRGGLRGPAFRAVMARLRDLDPGMRKAVAKAVVDSRGDAEALRVALARLDTAPSVPSPAAARPPTVVDARAGSRRTVLVLLVAFVAAVGWLALTLGQ